MTRRTLLKRSALILLACGVIGGVGYGIASVLRKDTPVPPKPAAHRAAPKPQTPAPTAQITLIATGDMLPHDTVNQAARTSQGYDYTPLFSQVHHYLTSADLAYCNQESPSDPARGVSGYPTFNAPASFASDLQYEGCNIINLANNHADDRGQAGINGTLDVWNKLSPLAVAGTARSAKQQNEIAYFSAKGVRFAFLSYTQCSNNRDVSSYGVNILNRELADKQLAAAKAHADMVLVGMHSCVELHSTQSSWQEKWAKYFADKGVDVVIGTGPHWLQPVDRLPKAGGGKTLVWYSLGNFLSSQEELNGLFGGIAVMTIDPETKAVTAAGFMPTYMHYEWTASQKAAGDLLARHNLKLYPLDQAGKPLQRSQNHTTVTEQTTRITTLLNRYTTVQMLTSQTFDDFSK